MRLTRQCFILSRALIDAFSYEEVNATYADMEEMGIAHLPYPDLDIIMPFNLPFALKGEATPTIQAEFDATMARLRYTGGEGVEWYIDMGKGWRSLTEIGKVDKFGDDLGPYARGTVLESYRVFLIVALATRNIIKEVRPNKAARLGIGKAAREGYAATTTLHIGTITENITDGLGDERNSPRPHLRRGHIRRQHYGPLNELVKKIWVAPTMVNVDQGFVDRRTAYNVSGGCDGHRTTDGNIRDTRHPDG